MKKNIVLLLLTLLPSIFIVKAQSDQSAPSTQDAIDFVNKINLQFSETLKATSTTYDEWRGGKFYKIEIKDCKLYVYYSIWVELKNSGDPKSKAVFFYCVVINLPNVSIDNSSLVIYSTSNGDIKAYQLTKYNVSGIYAGFHPVADYYDSNFTELRSFMQTNVHQDVLYSNPYGHTRYDGMVISSCTIDNNLESFNLLDICNAADPVFIDNSYAARLKKAYQLIIKNCSVGRLKVSSSDKF